MTQEKKTMDRSLRRHLLAGLSVLVLLGGEIGRAHV